MKIRRKVYSDIQRKAYSVASQYLHTIGRHPLLCDTRTLGYVMTLENLLSKISTFNITDWYRNVEQTLTVASFDDMLYEDQQKLQEVIQKFIEPDMFTFDMREACMECLRLCTDFSDKILCMESVEIEFDETLEQFYNYLKKKYGTGDEVIGYSGSSILCKSGVKISGFRSNNPKHVWQIHLEKLKDHDALIVGEEFPEPHRMWSRVFSIKKNHDTKNYGKYWFEVIQNMPFEKGFDFETLRVFTKVCEDFFAEVEIKSPVEAV